jgi:isopenicillin-N N-acyltransferase-like protein
MTSRPLKLIELMGDDSLSIGHQHGETFRREIREIAEIRLERMCNLSPYRRIRDVLTLAEEHLPIMQEFDVDLFLELRGISEASSVSLEKLVVLNHYTDMRDIILDTDSAQKHMEKHDNGGCSIIYSPTNLGPLLGQTWDIHGSAEPYTIMIRRNDALLFSITGCLGMTGMNRHGVCIAINNLASIDAKVGILWPALIRKILSHHTAQCAKDEIMKAPLGSGRHFAVIDHTHFFSIETSGTKKKIVWDKPDQVYFHTNHCLDEEMRKTHVIHKDSTTLWRYQQLDEVIRHQDLTSAEQVFLALREVSIPKDKKEPHRTATCGTVVMDVERQIVVACQGIANKELLRFAETKVHV